MKYLFSFLIVLFSMAASAQVQRAKDDLPENKINPNASQKKHVVFDKKMEQRKSNKRLREKKRKREEREEIKDYPKAVKNSLNLY